LRCIFSGLSTTKEIRISANSAGNPQVFYKFDSSQPGWYPKPFEKKHKDSWNRVFGQTDIAQGNVITVSDTPCFERGYRQHWNYKVGYAGGSVVDLLLKCISIPVSFDYLEAPTLLEHIQLGNHQKFNGELIHLEYKNKLTSKIASILRNRDCEEDIAQWEAFIYSLPHSPDFNLGTNYINVFYQLVNEYGGDIQVIKLINFYSLQTIFK